VGNTSAIAAEDTLGGAVTVPERPVLVAPDSFKGTFRAPEVAAAIGRGLERAGLMPPDLCPVADGGEGTLDALLPRLGGEVVGAVAHDPLGRELKASFGLVEDGGTAIVETATASGLGLVGEDERDAWAASTYGTGELIAAAAQAGAAVILVPVGGSATTDGGAGILTALGAAVAGDRIDLTGLDGRLADVDLRIACDVTNPLLGPTGAAATYGPQKGATPAQVAQLDRALDRYAHWLMRATGHDERATPGAGAAGGTAFGLLSIADRFASIRLVPGVEVVMEETGLREKLDGADLVITGEGRIDAQTAFGKTALGVARQAHASGVRCIAVGGGVEPEGIEALRDLDVAVMPVVERPQSVEEAMAAGFAPVRRCGERLARLVSMWAR
jgi:glycerate kinase